MWFFFFINTPLLFSPIFFLDKSSFFLSLSILAVICYLSINFIEINKLEDMGLRFSLWIMWRMKGQGFWHWRNTYFYNFVIQVLISSLSMETRSCLAYNILINVNIGTMHWNLILMFGVKSFVVIASLYWSSNIFLRDSGNASKNSFPDIVQSTEH